MRFAQCLFVLGCVFLVVRPYAIAHESHAPIVSTDVEPRVGAYFVYEYTKERREQGKPDQSETITVRIEIVSVGPSGIRLTYHHDDLGLLESLVPSEQRLIETLNSIKYDIKVLPGWEGIEIVNQDEVFETSRVIAQELIEILGRGKPEVERDQIKDSFNSVFGDPEIVHAAKIQVLSVFFFPMGWEGEHGTTRAFDTVLEGPMGGGIPSKIRTTLRKVPKSNLIKFDSTHEPDPEATMDYLYQISQTLLARMGKDPVARDEFEGELELIDTCTGVIDTELGMPREIEFRRVVRVELPEDVADQRGVSTYSWELIEHGVLED